MNHRPRAYESPALPLSYSASDRQFSRSATRRPQTWMAPQTRARHSAGQEARAWDSMYGGCGGRRHVRGGAGRRRRPVLPVRSDRLHGQRDTTPNADGRIGSRPLLFRQRRLLRREREAELLALLVQSQLVVGERLAHAHASLDLVAPAVEADQRSLGNAQPLTAWREGDQRDHQRRGNAGNDRPPGALGHLSGDRAAPARRHSA